MMISSILSRFRGSGESTYSESDMMPRPEGTSLLCDQCRHMLRQFVLPKKNSWDKWSYPFRFNLKTWKSCDLCTTLMHSISSEQQGELLSRKNIFFEVRGDSTLPVPRMTFLFKVNPYIKGGNGTYRYIQFYWYPEESFDHKIAESTNAESNWTLAKTWYSNCCKNHKCSSSEARKLPTRLIQINSSKTTSTAKLYISSSQSRDIEYCTLSHCWGTKPIVKLRQSNIDEFKGAIPLQSLSKTFKEAIEAAKRFGFQYIWIDSLCIIQDDPEDWQRESAIMADVYSGSSLNFAATGAVDGDNGCFFNRDPRIAFPCKVYLANSNNFKNGIYQCVTPQHWILGVEGSPLARRAWILQERVMAPRTLHFGRSQIHWECGGLLACETYPHGSPGLLTCRDPFVDNDINGNLKTFENPLEFWQRIVAIYSRCFMTKEQDKLVALSAVSKMIQNITGDQFVVGLWRKDLERQLRWSTRRYIPQCPPVRRVSRYRGPSWSWVSIEGPIVLPNLTRKDNNSQIRQPVLKVTISSVDIKFASPNPFGQVEFASLRLQCQPLKRALSRYSADKENKIKWHLTVGSTELQYSSLDEDPSSISQKHEVFLLIIAEKEKSPSNYQTVIEGLVLKRDKEKSGHFYRVGNFYCFTRPSYESIKAASSILDKEFYEELPRKESNGNWHCVITLL